jgi:hypothetical protein
MLASLRRRLPMTEWILDREHPLKGVARVCAIVLALMPVIAIVVLIAK